MRPRESPAWDAFELDVRFRELVLREQRVEAELAPLLRDAPYLVSHAGISARKGRALIRLERAAAPQLLAAFRAGRVSWVQAGALVRLLQLPQAIPFAEGWIRWAEQVTVRRLHEDVDDALEAVAIGDVPSPPEDPARQTRAHPSSLADEPTVPAETAQFSFSAPAEVVRFLRAVVGSLRRRLHCTDGHAWGWIFDHALEAWGADNPRVEREHRVFARDGWRCTIPGCSSYRNLQDHHVVFRSAGGGDELTNRTTLCAYHHQRGVHAGRVRVFGTAPDGLRFELGLRVDLPPLLAYRSGDLRCAS
jgi:hypothetical protein